MLSDGHLDFFNRTPGPPWPVGVHPQCEGEQGERKQKQPARAREEEEEEKHSRGDG
jgi:hypothetical protein